MKSLQYWSFYSYVSYFSQTTAMLFLSDKGVHMATDKP